MSSTFAHKAFTSLAFGAALLSLAAVALAAEPAKDGPHADLTPAVANWPEVRGKLVHAPDDVAAFKAALTVAQQMAKDPATAHPASLAFRQLASIAIQSNEPKLAAAAPKLAGIGRHLDLLGHPMKVGGRLVDGTPLDTKKLEGKVVLIDFWATWCKACRAELPNVKANYEKYHSRGFEVVGVSLDTNHDTLAEFVEKEQLTWPVLFTPSPTGRGWDNPIAVFYGITSIPAAILVDQKGNVVSLNARGPELGRQIEKLLGDAGVEASR